jgi:hypothetical protein
MTYGEASIKVDAQLTIEAGGKQRLQHPDCSRRLSANDFDFSCHDPHMGTFVEVRVAKLVQEGPDRCEVVKRFGQSPLSGAGPSANI